MADAVDAVDAVEAAPADLATMAAAIRPHPHNKSHPNKI
jgi:hypothetical protein